jgi:hypothetical protein
MPASTAHRRVPRGYVPAAVRALGQTWVLTHPNSLTAAGPLFHSRSPSPPVLSSSLTYPPLSCLFACFPFNSYYYPSLPFPFCHTSASLLSSFSITSSSAAFFPLELASSPSDLRPSSLLNPAPSPRTQARDSRTDVSPDPSNNSLGQPESHREREESLTTSSLRLLAQPNLDLAAC